MREPLDIVRISTALFVRVEQGEWTGILEKEVENFENILKRVLERVSSEDVERRKKLQSFGIVGSHCIYASECANVRCDIITSRMAVA
ncbi:10275_t:CDS:2, partial [Funneliformis geosporum]